MRHIIKFCQETYQKGSDEKCLKDTNLEKRHLFQVSTSAPARTRKLHPLRENVSHQRRKREKHIDL